MSPPRLKQPTLLRPTPRQPDTEDIDDTVDASFDLSKMRR